MSSAWSTVIIHQSASKLSDLFMLGKEQANETSIPQVALTGHCLFGATAKRATDTTHISPWHLPTSPSQATMLTLAP